MPRQWDADTDLATTDFDGQPIPFPPPGPNGSLSEKRTWIGVMWDHPDSLRWYSEASLGTRGFEVEGFPASADDEWSIRWSAGSTEQTWASNLPNAYRDDLTFDQLCEDPFPEDCDGISHFAIGTPHGRALELNTYYWSDYQTDTGETDGGDVRIHGQAVRRANSDELENLGYCASNFGLDESCYFGEFGLDVADHLDGRAGRYPIGEGGFWQQYALPLPPLGPPEVFFDDCPGHSRINADGSERTTLSSPSGPVSPDGSQLLGWDYVSDISLYGRDGAFVRSIYSVPIGASIHGWTFDPSGGAFWMGRYDNGQQDTTDIYRVDFDTGTASPRIGWPGDQYDPTLSPDGSRLGFFSDTTPTGTYLGAFGQSHDYDGFLYVASSDGGSPQLLVGPDRIDQGFMAKFSPDGSKLALIARETNGSYGSILVVDAQSGQTVFAKRNPPNAPPYQQFAYGVAWLSNDRLAYSRYTSINAVNLDGSNEQALAETCEYGSGVETRVPSLR